MSQADAEHPFDECREAYLFFEEEQMPPRRGVNTPQLCCVASLMPRQLATGYLTFGDTFLLFSRYKLP